MGKGFLFPRNFSIAKRYRKVSPPKPAVLARTNGARVGFKSHTSCHSRHDSPPFNKNGAERRSFLNKRRRWDLNPRAPYKGATD